MNKVTTTTTIFVTFPPCYRPVCTAHHHTHTLAWEAAAAAHSEGATRMRTVISSAASCLCTKNSFVHHHSSPRTTLLCFFFFKLLRPFYIFVQLAQPNQTKRKDQSAQEEPLGRGVSGKWDEIGTKREIVQMTSTGSRRVAGHTLLPRPCPSGLSRLAGLVLSLSGVTSQGVPRSRLVPPRHHIWVIN
jgi:hypothetical protein